MKSKQKQGQKDWDDLLKDGSGQNIFNYDEYSKDTPDQYEGIVNDVMNENDNKLIK